MSGNLPNRLLTATGHGTWLCPGSAGSLTAKLKRRARNREQGQALQPDDQHLRAYKPARPDRIQIWLPYHSSWSLCTPWTADATVAEETREAEAGQPRPATLRTSLWPRPFDPTAHGQSDRGRVTQLRTPHRGHRTTRCVRCRFTRNAKTFPRCYDRSGPAVIGASSGPNDRE